MPTLETMPVYPVPDEVRGRAGALPVVEGLVAQPGPLVVAALSTLPKRAWKGDFACKDGWTVPGQLWRGVRLLDAVALAKPAAAARYLHLSSGTFALSLAIADAGEALLCTTLNDEPLTLEHGGPCRLYVPGAECYTSMKWVERIEVLAEPREGTARTIALARIAAAAGD